MMVSPLPPLLLLLLLTFSTKGQLYSNESLCEKNCTRSDGLPNCQYENNTIIRLDLSGCNISRVHSEFFSRDPDIGQNLSTILAMNLSENPLSWMKFSLESLRGMKSLTELMFPSETFSNCPGDAVIWNSTKTNDILTCTINGDYCVFLATEYALNNTGVCPSNSDCINDGPSLISCICEPGYFGYKCLRKGEFPFAIFFGSLGSLTVVLSAFLWFTERRFVKKHQ